MRNKPPVNPERLPKPGERWRHLKRNSEYVIVGVADRETGYLRDRVRETSGGSFHRPLTLRGPGWDVVYTSFNMPGADELHTRDLFEFLDGRFEKVA